MTKNEFKKYVHGIAGWTVDVLRLVRLDRNIAKIALKKGWVKPFDLDLICHKRDGNKYLLNRKKFPLNLVYMDSSLDDYIEAMVRQVAMREDEEIMKIFLESSNTHLINRSTQIKHTED